MKSTIWRINYGCTCKNAVSTGKPKVAGSVYIGSAAAAAPADATTELGTGWTPLGYVGEDGVTNENSPETDSKKAWGGDIVLKLQTEKAGHLYL